MGALVDATPDELSEIITALREDGLRGLILDLRWCPGGSLKGSVRSAELLLGEGTIATINYRGQPEEVLRSVNDGKLTGFPIVVLINNPRRLGLTFSSVGKLASALRTDAG